MSDAFSAIKAQEEALLCRSYSRYPVAVVRGKGSRLWDVDGKEYVALLAGMAAVLLIRLLSAHFRWNLPRVKDETL